MNKEKLTKKKLEKTEKKTFFLNFICCKFQEKLFLYTHKCYLRSQKNGLILFRDVNVLSRESGKPSAPTYRSCALLATLKQIFILNSKSVDFTEIDVTHIQLTCFFFIERLTLMTLINSFAISPFVSWLRGNNESSLVLILAIECTLLAVQFPLSVHS